MSSPSHSRAKKQADKTLDCILQVCFVSIMILVLNGDAHKDAHSIDLHLINGTLQDPPFDLLLDLFVLSLERGLLSPVQDDQIIKHFIQE